MKCLFIVLLLVALGHTGQVKRVGNYEFYDLQTEIIKTPTHGDFTYVHHVKNEDFLGAKTTLKYNVTVVPGLVSLDLLDQVVDVECGRDSLDITFRDGPIVWPIGTLLAGSAQWLCIGNHNTPTAFYRLVEGSHSIDESVVRYRTVNKTFIDCFRDSDISLLHRPPPSLTKSRSLQFDKIINLTLFSIRENASIFAPDPFFSIGGNFDFDVNVGVEFQLVTTGLIPALNLFKVQAFASASFNAGLQAKAGIMYTWTKSITLLTIPLPTITFFIGIVPIDIAPSFELDLVGSLSTTDQIVLSTSVAFVYEYIIGTMYTEQTGFQKIQQAPSWPTFTFVPPTLTATAIASAKVQLTPKVVITLWDVIPFAGGISAYLNASLNLLSKSCNPVSPQVTVDTGISYSVALDAIQVLGSTYTFGGFLPFNFISGPIVPNTHLYQKCFLLENLFSESLFYWEVGPWSTCSASCGNGTQTRNISCVDGGTPEPASSCSNSALPATVQNCVSLVACPVCTNHPDCNSCLMDSRCYWCSDTPSCIPYANSTCNNPNTYQCAKEPQINVLWPNENSEFSAGQPVNITWTGGPVGGMVYIFFTWDSNSPTWYTGDGIPDYAVPNTGFFTWNFQGGIPTSSYYSIAVTSAVTSSNMYITNNFFLDGTCETQCYVPVFTAWSGCSVTCGTGVSNRTEICFDSKQEMVNNANCGNPNATLQSCTVPCTNDFALQITSPTVGATFVSGTDEITLTWTGGQGSGKVRISYGLADAYGNVHNWTVIKSSTSNSYSYQFLASMPPGVNYALMLTSLTTPSNYAIIGGIFISGPVTYKMSLTLASDSSSVTKSESLQITLIGMFGNAIILWPGPLQAGATSYFSQSVMYTGPLIRSILSTNGNTLNLDASELVVTTQDGNWLFGLSGTIANLNTTIDRYTCNNSQTCNSCSARIGCGWCSSSLSCAPGTSTGSLDGLCSGIYWLSSTSQCPVFTITANFTTSAQSATQGSVSLSLSTKVVANLVLFLLLLLLL